MKDVLPVWGLAIIVVLTMPPLAAGSDSVAVPSGGAQYAYNKNNPRWEAPQHVPVKKFHKPYKPLRQPPGALPGRHQRGSMFLSADVVIGLTSIVVLSVAAQWVSWSIGLPAALVSIVFGIAAGPAGGFLDPDILLGNLLLPTLSLLLALVIFDACRRLRFSELPKTKGTTTSLVSIGLLSTWLVGAGTAYLAAGFDGPLAVLIGAVLVAIGPTTIAELTQHTRLPRWLGAVVAWEAALTELVGMVLTILLFIGIAYGHFHGWPAVILMGESLGLAAAVGVVAAGLLIVVLLRHWVPDFLRRAVCVSIVIGAATVSNVLRAESGLLAVVVMGLVVANQHAIDCGREIDLERLSAQLMPAMLIVIAARLEAAHLVDVALSSVVLAAAMVIVARPVAVMLSTARLGLRREERLFLSWLAPRGVMAAVVVTLMGLRLAEIGYPNADRVAPVSVLVIAATVAFYWIAAPRAARWLEVGRPKESDTLTATARP